METTIYIYILALIVCLRRVASQQLLLAYEAWSCLSIGVSPYLTCICDCPIQRHLFCLEHNFDSTPTQW